MGIRPPNPKCEICVPPYMCATVPMPQTLAFSQLSAACIKGSFAGKAKGNNPKGGHYVARGNCLRHKARN